MNKQMRLARLWDGARHAMLKNQYPAPEARAARFRQLAKHLEVKGIWQNAAANSGTPALVGLKPEIDGKWLKLSDGDAASLKLIHENYPGWSAQCVRWQELPVVFGKNVFGAIEITGNSLPYAASWDGKRQPTAHSLRSALEDTIAAVFDALEKKGKFVFDLAKYGKGRHEVGKGYFLELKYSEGLRCWTVGNGNDEQTRAGLILDIGMINRMLRKLGFGDGQRIREEFQLDPKYYELFVAEKK